MTVKTEKSPPTPASHVVNFHRDPLYANPPEAIYNLDRNECLEPLPQVIIDEVRNALTGDFISKYPSQTELRGALASFLQVEEANIILTPGSDAGIRSIMQAYIEAGDKMLMLDPTYGMYAPYAELFGGEAVKVSYNKDLSFDFDDLLNHIQPGVKVIALANPNQPINTLIEDDQIERLLERSSQVGALLVIDEAYYPFSGYTAMHLVASNPNLLVLRTFSKGFGMAGLRIGYAVGHPEVVGTMFKVRSAHDVNGAALLCAHEVLKHYGEVETHIAHILEGGSFLANAVSELGFEPILPIRTNFLLMKVAHIVDPKALACELLTHGYRIKGPFNHPSLNGMVRVTLGSQKLMSRFFHVLRKCVLNLQNNT